MIDHRLRRPNRTTNGGFTLIELLVVVVILGILSAVVVFAVRGAGDKGERAAVATDERIIRTAEETHCAQYGKYVPISTPENRLGESLIGSRLLNEPPTYHEVSVSISSDGPCNGTGFTITCKDGSPMPDCDATAPGGHPLVNSAAVCPQPNGWCVDAATPGGTPFTPGGTPEWGEMLQSMVQLPNGKVFAVYRELEATCNAGFCNFVEKSGLFDPAKQPNQRWTPGPTFMDDTASQTALYSLLVIEGTDGTNGTDNQCGERCGQVLANVTGWRLYNPKNNDNTWTPTPPPPSRPSRPGEGPSSSPGQRTSAATAAARC